MSFIVALLPGDSGDLTYYLTFWKIVILNFYFNYFMCFEMF